MSAYPAYNFGSAAEQRQQYDRYAIEVLPGGAREKRRQSQPEQSFTAASAAARAIIALVVMFALIGVVRITLSSATVAAAMETREINSAIEQARADGNSLEVEQSLLSNPTRIKTEATALKISSPEHVTFISLEEDIVVKDSNGNLSLSGSISQAVKAQG